MRHLPWAIVGTPLAATLLYLMLAFSLVTVTEPSPAAYPAYQGPPWDANVSLVQPPYNTSGAPLFAGASWPWLYLCLGREVPGEPQLSFVTAFAGIQGACPALARAPTLHACARRACQLGAAGAARQGVPRRALLALLPSSLAACSWLPTHARDIAPRHTHAGMKWMQYVISLAALLGIVTALTVGLFSVSRIVMTAARDWLLPPVLARISPRTQTPLIAQMTFGVLIGGWVWVGGWVGGRERGCVPWLPAGHACLARRMASPSTSLPPTPARRAALLALFVEVTSATALVSFGTLVSLWVVCNAQLWRRYWPEVQMRFTRCAPGRPAAAARGGEEQAAGAPAWCWGCWSASPPRGAPLRRARRREPASCPAWPGTRWRPALERVLTCLHRVPPPRAARYGTVEASARKVATLSWMPTLGQRLPLSGRKALVAANMLAVNAAAIGAPSRRAFPVHGLFAKRRAAIWGCDVQGAASCRLGPRVGHSRALASARVRPAPASRRAVHHPSPAAQPLVPTTPPPRSTPRWCRCPRRRTSACRRSPSWRPTTRRRRAARPTSLGTRAWARSGSCSPGSWPRCASRWGGAARVGRVARAAAMGSGCRARVRG